MSTFFNTVLLNAKGFKDKPEFQNDWTLNNENFEISILEYGFKFASKKNQTFL